MSEPALNTCYGCRAPVERMGYCQECILRSRREEQQRAELDRVQELRDMAGRAIGELPLQPFASFQNPEFRKSVHADLLALGASFLGDTALLVLGDTGIGKSSVLSAWERGRIERARDAAIAATDPRERKVLKDKLRELITAATIDFEGRRREPGLLWTTGAELAVARRNSPLGNEAPLVASAKRAAMLVVDDVGFEQPCCAGVLFDIVNERYSRGRHTLVTSGMKLEAFSKIYDAALVRRIGDAPTGLLVDLHEP